MKTVLKQRRLHIWGRGGRFPMFSAYELSAPYNATVLAIIRKYKCQEQWAHTTYKWPPYAPRHPSVNTSMSRYSPIRVIMQSAILIYHVCPTVCPTVCTSRCGIKGVCSRSSVSEECLRPCQVHYTGSTYGELWGAFWDYY